MGFNDCTYSIPTSLSRVCIIYILLFSRKMKSIRVFCLNTSEKVCFFLETTTLVCCSDSLYLLRELLDKYFERNAAAVALWSLRRESSLYCDNNLRIPWKNYVKKFLLRLKRWRSLYYIYNILCIYMEDLPLSLSPRGWGVIILALSKVFAGATRFKDKFKFSVGRHKTSLLSFVLCHKSLRWRDDRHQRVSKLFYNLT